MSKLSIDGLHISKGLVYQEVDLEKLFGVDVSSYSSLKERFGQACIDAITQRAQQGLNYKGGKLPNYSEGYSNSAEFKAYGKNKYRPDETLKGDMLNMMDVISSRGNVIRFGWDDETNAEKARGHITGYEGHKYLSGSAKREFFGLTRPQLENIMIEFEDDIKKIKESAQPEEKSAAQQLLEYLSDNDRQANQQMLTKALGINFDE